MTSLISYKKGRFRNGKEYIRKADQRRREQDTKHR